MWLKYPGEMVIYTPREFHSHHTQVHLVTWYMHPWTVQQKIIVSNWGRTSWNLWMKTCKRTSNTFVKLMSCTKKSPEHLWLNNYLLNECTTFNHSPGRTHFLPIFFFTLQMAMLQVSLYTKLFFHDVVIMSPVPGASNISSAMWS